MQFDFAFFFNSILIGIGLAMDAFSVSLANGLHETRMKKCKIFLIASVFAVFQALMPMIGWLCVHTLAEKFVTFQKFIPWIALVLLLYIGIGMIKESRQDECSISGDCGTLSLGTLIVQGIATSIDALSVGFTISEYGSVMAFAEAIIIATVTFFICYAGVVIGKHWGTKFSGKSSVLGGCILIFIGLKIFIEGVILPLVK